jgi:hypothetical protein
LSEFPFFQDALDMLGNIRFARIVKGYDLLLGQPKISVDQFDFDLGSIRLGVVNDDNAFVRHNNTSCGWYYFSPLMSIPQQHGRKTFLTIVSRTY